MALAASGILSIGGTTTNRSINLELGLAQNANSSLNQTNFRSLAGVASGTISLEDFYGASADTCKSVEIYYDSESYSNACGGEGEATTYYTDDCDFSCDCYELYDEDCEDELRYEDGYYSDKSYYITVNRGRITACSSCVR